MTGQGHELSEEELSSIINTHDLDCNGVFDEVRLICYRAKSNQLEKNTILVMCTQSEK